MACAYAAGLAEGRRQFAAELLPALREAFPGKSLQEGIASHQRAADRLQRRRQADADASRPRPGDRLGIADEVERALRQGWAA